MSTSLVNGIWAPLLASQEAVVAIHDLPPAFWKYANYPEGLYAYNEATVAQKNDGTVNEFMGQVGFVNIEGYANTKTYLENIHTAYNYPYPNDIAPQDSDSNSQWWEWVISAFKQKWETESGGIIAGLTALGSFPVGIHDFHPDIWKLIDSSIIRWNVNPLNYSDDLENNNSIFSASSNASIVDFEDSKVEKLTGVGTTAHGLISFSNDEWKFATRVLVSFDINFSVDSTLTIFPLHNTPILFTASNISFFGTNYTNVCSINQWYTIKLWIDVNNYYLMIYQGNTCLMYTKVYTVSSAGRSSQLLIKTVNGDALIKNVSVYASDNLNSILWNFAKWDMSAYTTGNTYAQHLDKTEKEMLRELYNQSYPMYLFSHSITDPDIKRDDGTLEGVTIDRSYNGFSESLTWIKNINTNTNYVNMYSFVNKPVSLDRRNLAKNGNFLDTIGGKTGEIWGYGFAKDATETTAFSKDGTNVVKLTSGASQAINCRVERGGIKWIKFYAKGNFQIEVDNDNIRPAGYTLNTYTSAIWKYYEIPVYYPDLSHSKCFKIYFIAVTDLYLHKLVIDDK